nr:hypothetical protein [Tanacetum cinerariifolium]
MTESLLVDSSLVVLVFSPVDDLISCLNKAMAFLTAIASLRVTVQQVQGRQGKSYSGTGYKSNATSFGKNNASKQARVVKCYNCQDPRVPDGQAAQKIIPNNAAFHTEDLDTYDSNCDDVSNAKALNQLSEDFRKRFTPQQELSVEKAFWFRISNPTIESSNKPPVKVEVPSKLPKVFKDQFDSIKKTHVRTTEQRDSLIDKLNLKSAENEDLKAQIQDKVFVITSLKNNLQKLKEKEIVDIVVQTPSAYTIVLDMFKLDLNLWLLGVNVYVRDTFHNAIKLSAKKVVVKPKTKIKKVRFAEPLTSSSNIKQKSMFDGVHDMHLLDFVENVNSQAKSAKKHKKQNIWKPTSHVHIEVGLKWKPTGITFTIVGTSCPLTRITSANIVPPRKPLPTKLKHKNQSLKSIAGNPKM